MRFAIRSTLSSFVATMSVLVGLAGNVDAEGGGVVSYSLEQVASPTSDQSDAYAQIHKAMDSAIGYYNKYTSIRKSLHVRYEPATPTADANSDGTVRFGSSRSYMSVITAMHEIGHTAGVGTTTQYQALISDGVFTGTRATTALRQITGDPASVLKGDTQHIWPYGLNYATEVKSTTDLVDHCLIVDALYKDLYDERGSAFARLRSKSSATCMLRKSTGPTLGSCTDSSARARLVPMGEGPGTTRIEFGDQVLETSSGTTATGREMSFWNWNGGAHQRFLLEAQSQFPGTVVRLKLTSGNLYARSNGTKIVQDAPGSSLETQYWELLSDSAFAATTTVQSFANPASPSIHATTDGIWIAGLHGDLRIAVLDAAGRLLASGTSSGGSLALPLGARGALLVVLQDQKGVVTRIRMVRP